MEMRATLMHSDCCGFNMDGRPFDFKALDMHTHSHLGVI